MKRTRIDIPPDLTFVPVPRRASSGGWNPQRQREFITVLAATGSVAQAVAVVGMSKTGAYLLRNAKGGGDFRRAWDAAIEDGVAVLRSVAFERAVDGVESTIQVDGKPVRTIHQYDNAMLMRLLAIYDTPERSAARQAARVPQVSREQLVERFRMLVRRNAERSVAETEQVTGETEAAAVARLYGPLGRPAPTAAATVPPMANHAPHPGSAERRDEPGRCERPEAPRPRNWSG